MANSTTVPSAVYVVRCSSTTGSPGGNWSCFTSSGVAARLGAYLELPGREDALLFTTPYSIQKERLVTSVRGVPSLSDSSSSCPVDQVESMLCL